MAGGEVQETGRGDIPEGLVGHREEVEEWLYAGKITLADYKALSGF